MPRGTEDVPQRSSRRSRLPKRFLDDDYIPTPSVSKRRSSTPLAAASTPVKTPKQPAKKAGPPAKKARRSTRSQKYEEEKIYEEDSDNSSDEDYPSPKFEEMIEEEEELELDFVPKVEVIDESTNCPWIDMDPNDIPKLELPESSNDIPLPLHTIFDAIEAYEILRSHHRTLRLTPFLFEDFCAALISKNNSCLIAEIHIALLRVALKSDDEEMIHYSVNDTNNAVNIILHHLETMTYAEILRLYIEAYPAVDESVLEAINAYNYPFVGYESKLVVILFMCYRFLYSSEYRKVVNTVGVFKNEENCRVCGKANGRVVGCHRCEAAFHPECSSLNPFPEVLICNLCTQNEVKGVTDARPFDEVIQKEPLRMMPIGRDRHGRVYWFVARRVVVQSEDDSEIRYYSTVPQLYQLLDALDENFYEKQLCAFFRKNIDEFMEQMTLSYELSGDRLEKSVQEKIAKKQYVEQFPSMYLQHDNVKRMASILYNCRKRDESKMVKVEDEVKIEEDVIKNDNNKILSESLIGIHDGQLVNTFWSGGADMDDLLDYHVHREGDVIQAEKLWRMGDAKFDEKFMSYTNFYANNEMSESFAARKKTVDRKKYMTSKFSFMEEPLYAFEWSQPKDKTIYGSESLQEKCVGWTIGKFSRRIPLPLMHRRWRKECPKFENKLQNSTHGFENMARRLLELESAIRKPVFVPQWYNGLGQTRFERTTLEQRDTQTKEFQKMKKIELDAMAKELDDSFVRVNYTSTKYPNTYIMRQKGETYRNAGKGGMGGWYWLSKKCVSKSGPVPKVPNLSVGEEKPVCDEETKKANRKAKNLLNLTAKLTKIAESREKRDAVANNPELQKSFKFAACYSQSCGKSSQYSCYSVDCREKYWEKEKSVEKRRKPVVGQELMWPIPEVQEFGSKAKNLFVVQKKIVRKLCKTAGCQPVYIPGFNTAAKSNPAIWNYPAPRPCFDLCWRWQTLNSRSLHAVALQLRILWASIRWGEMDPEDTHPDRRVVIDHPTHDERRRVVWHHELGPFGQYERYLMEIEIIPLHNDDLFDEDDEAWSAKKERESVGARKNSKLRKTRFSGVAAAGTGGRRVPKEVKKMWFDGIELKLFEIRDYWQYQIKREEDTEKRKMREMAVKAPTPVPSLVTSQQQQQQLQAVRRAMGFGGPPPPQPQRRPPPCQLVQQQYSTPGGARMLIPKGPQSNPGYVNRANTPGSMHSYLPPNDPLHPQQLARRMGPQAIMPHRNGGSHLSTMPRPPRPIQHPQIRQSIPLHPQHSQDYRLNQQPSTSRAAAGKDLAPGTVQYRNVRVQPPPPQNIVPRPMRQTSNGYQFPEGAIRGGGRQNGAQNLVPMNSLNNPTTSNNSPSTIVKSVVFYKSGQPNYTQNPVGEPNQTSDMRRMVVPQGPKVVSGKGKTWIDGQLVVEEAIGANGSDGDEAPPIIPRYDQQPGQQAQPSSSSSQPVRRVYPQQVVGGVPVGQGKGPVIVIKRNDGPSGMMVRQAAVPRITSDGHRIVQIRGATNVRPGMPPGRIVRIQQPGGIPPRQYLAGPQIQKARIVPRGGTTMQMAQQQQLDHRRIFTAKPATAKKVTTYRDFMASRGYLDSSRYLMPARPLLLPFEFNEEEEREISEAIAREEELMRLEEENKHLVGYDPRGGMGGVSSDPIKQHPYVSNLLPSINDTQDDKIIKQVLDVMFSQVCRWDKQYGWSKIHLKKARQKTDTEKIQLRKIRMNQREMILAEHIERLKKEINKRRTKLENEAEQQCGMLTPWRKARSRPTRTAKVPKSSANAQHHHHPHEFGGSSAKKEVINPADISLGGDTFDYSAQGGEKRRRRVSTRSAASREEQAAKRRRVSESQEEEGTGVGTVEGGDTEKQMDEIETEREAREPSIDRDALHCVCQTVYDEKKFYLMCGMCSKWYHGDCMSISEKNADRMENWACPSCQEEVRRHRLQQPQLYCVCRKPYDNTQFYVGCDSCQGWFHLECVNITQSAAEEAAEFICPDCQEQAYESDESGESSSSSVQLRRPDYEFVMQLLEVLMEHRMSTPFRYPVNVDEFPDYLQIVKKPMDLSTISSRVEALQYNYMREFVADVNQMFENAKKYNPADHAIFKCAETMQEVFEKKLQEVRDIMQQQQNDNNIMRRRLNSESHHTLEGSLDIEADQLLPIGPNDFEYADYLADLK